MIQISRKDRISLWISSGVYLYGRVLHKQITRFCIMWGIVNTIAILIGVVGFYISAFEFYDFAIEWYSTFDHETYLTAMEAGARGEKFFNLAKIGASLYIFPIVLWVLSGVILKEEYF